MPATIRDKIIPWPCRLFLVCSRICILSISTSLNQSVDIDLTILRAIKNWRVFLTTTVRFKMDLTNLRDSLDSTSRHSASTSSKENEQRLTKDFKGT